MPVLQLKAKDKQGKLRNSGRIEIKNQTEESAELYFYGDICSEAWQSEWFKDDKAPSDVEEFLKQLDGVQTLHVHINSGGGSVTGGIAIGNMLKRYEAYTIAYIDAIAASIATVIALSCDEVHIYPNSIFMIHKPLSVCLGNADDMRKEAEVLDTCQDCILATYMTKVKEGVTEEDITEKIDAETWFTGTEAADYFDMVLEEGMENAAATANSQYFDKYSNAPDNLTKDDEPEDKPQNDLEKIKQEIVDDVIQIIKDKFEEKDNDEDGQGDGEDIETLKEDILKDLDYI